MKSIRYVGANSWSEFPEMLNSSRISIKNNFLKNAFYLNVNYQEIDNAGLYFHFISFLHILGGLPFNLAGLQIIVQEEGGVESYRFSFRSRREDPPYFNMRKFDTFNI